MRKTKDSGVTLMTLTVTIIILLILTGISIAVLHGNNKIIDRTVDATTLLELKEIEEEANLIYLEKKSGKYERISGNSIIANVVNELKSEGYNILTINSQTDSVTGIDFESDIYILKNTEEVLQVEFDGDLYNEASYYAVVRGKNFLITEDSSGINIERRASEVSIENNIENQQNILQAEITSGETIEIKEIEGNNITLKSGNAGGMTTIRVSYGEYSKVCNVSVMTLPTSTSVADANTTFSTEYGKIDVIWLSGTGNIVTSTPNAPNLSGMTPVSWTLSGDTWTEDSNTNESYYSYTAGSGNNDNTSSRWANAKNSDGSYFVWIPRYAYRITYYASSSSTQRTGYYDGWGMWKASDGSLKYALDSGIETIEYEGLKYIVHPAFCGTSVGYDNGSWSSNISGFWAAKYEMSRNGATDSSEGSGYSTTFKSVPNVQSARSITIGNMYNVAKSYDTSKESHLMKNSEWGAVAYLTHSKYGRNGNEIDINNSNNRVTGSGGGHPNVAWSASGLTNVYNTTTGAKASTTGNVYGIYDMSGGCCESIAAFNNTDTNGKESTYGSSFASTSGSSDKYATKYYNPTLNTGNAIIYAYGKIGDATKEVNTGGGYALSDTSYYWNWFSDAGSLCSQYFPFFNRGGNFQGCNRAGLFSMGSDYGNGGNAASFRVVLCP